MKRLCFVAVLLFVAAVPAFAQPNAQYCFGSTYVLCQYLADEDLEQGTTYWDYSAGSGPSTVTDQCLWGNPNTEAADLDPGDSVYQTVDTDDFPVWRVSLKLYKTSTSATSNDYFKVVLYNYTTFQGETHLVYASADSGLCVNADIDLAFDYGNSTVRVRIEKNFNATATMYVGNVSLWGAGS